MIEHPIIILLEARRTTEIEEISFMCSNKRRDDKRSEMITVQLIANIDKITAYLSLSRISRQINCDRVSLSFYCYFVLKKQKTKRISQQPIRLLRMKAEMLPKIHTRPVTTKIWALSTREMPMRTSLNLIDSRRKLGSGDSSDLVTQFTG